MRHLFSRVGLVVVMTGVLCACSGEIGVNATGDRYAHLDEIGAGPLAHDFSNICIRNMRRASARFRSGVPTIEDGCACVGVRLERSGELTSSNMVKTKEAHGYVVEANRTYMSTYTNRELGTMRLPRGVSSRVKALSRGLVSAHEYCEVYTLDGDARNKAG